MTAPLASRVQRLQPSPTLAVATKAKAMTAAGTPVISLAAGEPDLPTPAVAIEAACQALREGATRYTAVKGIDALREAIADDSLRARGHRHDPATEIVVTVGAKQALFNLFQALLDEGDEVLLPLPSWVSYAPQVELAAGRPVMVPALPEDGFFPSVEALDAACGERTKALVWCSPNNPTGRVATVEQVEAMARWADARGVLVISDEIYRRICFRDAPEFVSPMRFLRPDQIILIDGVSKSHCMTGWRIGWALGAASLIGAMTRVQSHQTSNPTAASQIAAEAALRHGDEHVEQLVQSLEARRDAFVSKLARIEGLRVLPPQGAFYVLLDVQQVLPDGEDDLQFCARFLDEHAVAVVPGTAFGAPGWVRMSLAVAAADLDESARRLEAFVHGLR